MTFQARSAKPEDFAKMETKFDAKGTRQSLLLRWIASDGQSEVQRRLACGEPAPEVKQSLRRAGVPIRQFDRAMGTSAQNAKESLQALKTRLKPCRDVMFAELDRIAQNSN